MSLPSKIGEQPATNPGLDRTYPSHLESDQQTRARRVLAISPYGPLNAYYEYGIPQLDTGITVEILDSVETAKAPYINISKREANKPLPLFIVDHALLNAYEVDPEQQARARREAVAEILGEFAPNYIIGSGEAQKDNELVRWNDKKQIIRKILSDIGSYLSDSALEAAIAQADKKTEGCLRHYQVRFEGYYDWAQKNNVTYLSPSSIFGDIFAKEWRETGTVSVGKYRDAMEHDLRNVIAGKPPHAFFSQAQKR